MAALLDIRGLQISFGTAEAVRGASLQLDEGEVLGGSWLLAITLPAALVK